MSNGGKSSEVEAELIEHAIEGRLLPTIEVFYPTLETGELVEWVKELDDKYCWFVYRYSHIQVKDKEAATRQAQRLRNSAFK